MPHVASGITHSIVEVSPQLAAEWLKNFNKKNRPVSQTLINKLARRMTESRWRLNGQGLVFGTDEVLLDGQHRLLAIIESGCTIELLLVEGVDPSTWDTLDDGKTRSAGDVLGREGFINPMALASAARWLHRYESNMMRSAGSGRGQVSNGEILDLINGNPDLVKRLREVPKPKGLGLGLGLVTALFCVFSRLSEPEAQRFLTGLIYGSSLEAGSSILLLRQRLFDAITPRHKSGSRARLNDVEKAALIVKAWNADREGRELKSLRWRAQGASHGRERFPVAI